MIAQLLLGASFLAVAALAPTWPAVHVGDRLAYRQTTTIYFSDGPHVDRGGLEHFRVLAISPSQIACSYVSEGTSGYSTDAMFSDGNWRLSSGKVMPYMPFLESTVYLGGQKAGLRAGERWSFISNEGSVLAPAGPRTTIVTSVDGDRVELKIDGEGVAPIEADGQPEISSSGAPMRMRATFSASATFVGGVLAHLTDVVRTTQDQQDGPPQAFPIKVELDRE